MHTVTWLTRNKDQSLKLHTITTPSAMTAATLYFALRTARIAPRLWTPAKRMVA